ncbi:MAG: MurR/RpiR family transcriptional regulator [Oscillospiraceae bacterium]|nr:MurR/RpiR family transcriptional regulator [Oscillospiraceae bacterium]
MTIHQIIKEKFPDLTKSERKVASFCLGHFVDFSVLTLIELSNLIGTSTTTVIRFCNHLGFDSFKNFQTCLKNEINIMPTLSERFQLSLKVDADSVFTNTISHSVECIESTFSSIDFEKIDQVVDEINHARRVFLFGMKESQALVHYAYTRLYDIRGDVFLLDSIYSGDAEIALDINSSDICIVFLFHRYTYTSVKTLPFLKSRNAKVVLITNSPSESIEQYGDSVICCDVSGIGIKNCYAAPICLCDCIGNKLASLNPEKVQNRTNELELLYKNYSFLGS